MQDYTEKTCHSCEYVKTWTENGLSFWECRKEWSHLNEDETDFLEAEEAAKICPDFKIAEPEPEIKFSDLGYDYSYNEKGDLIIVPGKRTQQ